MSSDDESITDSIIARVEGSVTDSVIAQVADMEDERNVFLASRNGDEPDVVVPFSTSTDQVGCLSHQ